ncbi:histidine phosphatase family protein [Acidovorax sp. Leaf160]|uniref:histidine phosphatase family protein n=1 Tax=Acidovorax sp. Leaf160 TaxID=1736280 RepID=UPI0006F43341|nr:histidine phosphatase family protein [Acidovorax sp. Leaf160]KQR63088.1 phosphoglycerate mutase [Acidovorax sp. Leaf160]
MQATRIIAIRHGETAWNVDTRIQGHLDIPLNDTGLWQARRLGAALADEPLAAIYTSDLQRARTTAQAVADTTGAPLTLETGLRERGFGHFEGRTFVEIEAELPDEARRWRQREPDYAPAGGESLTTVRTRIAQTVHRLAARHTGEQMVLVAHGGVLDALYRLATGQDTQSPRTWYLGNAAINRLLWTPDGLTLVGWGDVGHLEAGVRDELHS